MRIHQSVAERTLRGRISLVVANHKCELIVDSCCDLPLALIKSLDVTLLQFPFTMDDGEHFDDLGESLSPHEFYDRLRRGEQAFTSQIPYHTLCECFEQAAQRGTPTVLLSFSSGLSGTFESIERAAAEVLAKHPDFELHLVDTRLASVAEGLLVVEAARQRDRGLSASELAGWAEEARFFVNAFFTLPDLETLKRGGRIPDVAAYASAKLDIKPILTFDLDGRLVFAGAARGRKKAIRQLLNHYFDRAQGIEQRLVVLGSADAPRETKQMEEQILKECGDSVPVILNYSVGPVIGAHTGADVLSIVFWGADRRRDLSITDRIANAVSSRNESLRSTLLGE